MPKYNRRCLYCGKEYYCCYSCTKKGSWKHRYCSTGCFQTAQRFENQSLNPIIINDGGVDIEMFIMKGILKNNRTVDVTGYDLELGKIDTYNETTFDIDEFKEFIVPVEEMKSFTNKPKIHKEIKYKKDIDYETTKIENKEAE